MAADDDFVWVGGIRPGEGVWLARDAGINLTVLRFHGEFEDLAVWNVIAHGHLGRRRMRGTEDKVAVLFRGGYGAIGQFLRLDVTWRIRIASGGRPTPRAPGRSLGDCRMEWSEKAYRKHGCGKTEHAKPQAPILTQRGAKESDRRLFIAFRRRAACDTILDQPYVAQQWNSPRIIRCVGTCRSRRHGRGLPRP